MKTCFLHPAKMTIVACAIALAGWNVFGLGSDWPNEQPANSPSWPQGIKDLVNITNRVRGFWVNSEDVFFFSGSATNFSSFLQDYSKIEGVQTHRLILHEGAGEAKAPWDKTSRPCDWKLYGCPAIWFNAHNPSVVTNYILEVHFWTGGKIALDQLAIPQNVELAGDCLKNFESITSGMTRAEVEKKLTMDGGLQGVSPVRFIDPGCPGFKISVEFDFQKNSADQNRAMQCKDDKVIQISKPYLARPFAD